MKRVCSRMTGSRSIGSAFTLIELLIVIAAISLLLAVMLPALHVARRSAHRAACQTNLRQIALAWNAYLVDNDHRLYQGLNADYDFGGWTGTGSGAISRPLNHHLGLPTKGATQTEAKVFRCPADQGDRDYGSLAYRYFGNSYQTNLLLVGPDAIPTWRTLPEPVVNLHRQINERLKNLSAASLSNPEQLLLVGDRNWVAQWDLTVKPDEGGRSWHDREAHYNLAFLDGHVEFVRICKGVYIDPDFTYRIQPFQELDKLTLEAQSQVLAELSSGD
ncbi:MAG: type II secretion system protein [Sedimentisphaerales bacterium]|nr:type II secretion system protein [Sedimentisphaerales bacterium]